MKIGILGAGNGGITLFADLSLKGKKAKIYSNPKFNKSLIPIVSAGKFTLHDEYTHTEQEIKFSTEDISYNLEEFLDSVDIIYNTTPIFAHDEVFKSIYHYLSVINKQIIFINLSGGFSLFSQMLIQKDHPLITIGATVTFPYACRVIETNCFLYRAKAEISCIFINSTDVNDFNTVQENFGRVNLLQHNNLLEFALSGPNFIIHPLITLMNVNKIKQSEKFLFYKDGLTNDIAKLLTVAEAERKNLAYKLGFKEFDDTLEQCRKYYDQRLGNWLDFAQLDIYANMLAPNSLNTRYIEEDIPYGLVPIWSLGKIFGIDMPVIRSLIDIAIVYKDCDYYKFDYNFIHNQNLAQFVLSQSCHAKIESTLL